MNNYEVLGIVFMGLFLREVTKDMEEAEYEIPVSEIANLIESHQVVLDDDKSEDDMIRVHIVKNKMKKNLLDYLPEDGKIMS